MTTSGKEGTGKGRQSTRRAQARRDGDMEEVERLTPPSERKIQPDEMCGALTQPGAIHPTCHSRKGARTDHPGFGTCAKHGGNTTAGIKSAMRQMGSDFARRYKEEFMRFGGDRHDPTIASLTPESALLEEVRRSAAMVRFLESRIAMWNLTEHSHDVIEAFVKAGPKRGDDPTMAQRVEATIATIHEEADLPALTNVHPRTGLTSFTDAREWLYLYREERGHLARVAKMCIDAGVAQRLVSIAEDQGRMLSTAIRAVLNALNLSPEQAALIPRIVPPILRAVATDAPIPDLTLTILEPSPRQQPA